jgi:uncharacterized protein (DUF58 family)
MIPQEILKKVRRIEIRSKRSVNSLFAGEYHSVFKGRGMEFAEVREYQHGDDYRTIDWKVTARMRRPYVKKFMEERELTVMLVVDASSSVEFGTATQMKGEMAAEICAVLAFSAIKNNDKVGLLIFTDRVEQFVPPKKGRKHVLRIIRDLLDFFRRLEEDFTSGQAQRRTTDLAVALQHLNRVVHRHSVVFLVSDFKTTGYETSLRIASQRHDIVAITLTDPREIDLPNVGFLELEDAETGEQILVDTRDPEVRRLFSDFGATERTERRKLFQSLNLDLVDVLTSEGYLTPLTRLFRERANRLR